MARLLKFLLKLVVYGLILLSVYLVALYFTIVPKDWTPRALFKQEYLQFKLDLSIRALDQDALASVAKYAFDFLNKIDEAYQQSPDAGTAGGSAAPASTAPASQPTDGSAPGAAAPGTDPNAQPQEQKSAVDKARETMDQYQKAIDNQQKVLDSL